MGDPFRVVMLMPGVGGVASGVSYPVVRGTQPAATGYFLDGIRLPALFHALLGPAVVSPEFIDTIDFYPGPSPPQYGRLMGGAIDGRTRPPRDDRVHATVSADLINTGAYLEVPLSKTGTEVTVAGRFSYTAWLIALLANVASPPRDPNVPAPKAIADFYDYQARLEQRVLDGKLRLLAFGSSDVFGVDSSNGGPKAVSARSFSIFHRVDLRYRKPLALGDGEVGFTFGNERIGVTGDQGGERIGEYVLRQSTFTGRASWHWAASDKVELTVGGDVDHHRSNADITGNSGGATRLGGGEPSAFRQPQSLGTFAGLYGQLVWRPTARWTVVPGLRLDNYHLVPGINHPAVEPRLTLRRALSEVLTVKAGAGLVHQPPTVMINLPVMDIAGLRYGLQEGAQFDLGAEWKAREGLEVNADVYYNPLFRAVEFDLAEVLQDRRRRGIAYSDVGGPGYAYGFELMVRHPLGDHWFGWLSYSFQRASRYERFSRFDDHNQILETVNGWVPFAFEQTHVVNTALSYKFGTNWTVGTVLHFNSGRPETGEISTRSMHPGTDEQTGAPLWLFDDRDRVARLPPFFRIDLRVSKSWAFDAYTLDAYLDVLNVTGSKEVLGKNRSVNYQADPPELVTDPIEIPVVVPILGLKGTY